MTRRPYTENPEAWDRASRTGQSRIDYASPVQIRRQRREDRVLLVLFLIACALLALGAI